MSACNYTQPILASTCIGDSLFTINQNFSAVDEGLCSVPDLQAGIGIRVRADVSEQLNNNVEVAVNNLYAYGTRFDSLTLATEQNITVSDGTSTVVTTFPYTASPSGPRPSGAFTAVALSNSAPQVSLYWTASGSDPLLTVYATNSSFDTSTRGSTWFNGPVTALYRADNSWYVGGEFTACGGAECKKFAVLQLGAGTLHPTLSTTGLSAASPFAPLGDPGLGDIGAVNSITTATAAGKDVLVIGGSYQSTSKGKGLSVFNQTDSTLFPFFVNGTVNSLCVDGDYLYIGGDFDFLLYGNAASSVSTGLRVYTKGFARISLTQLLAGTPDAAIDRAFAANITSLFRGNCSINSIAAYSSIIYAGGQFQCQGSGSTLTGQNLAAFNPDGTQNLLWQPIVNGPVYALVFDDTTADGGGVFLYAGGDFSRVFTSSQFYATRRINDDSTYFYNAAAFLVLTNGLAVDGFWKPEFNGPVTSFALHDSEVLSYLYCYGTFTEANNGSATYLAAVSKALQAGTSSGPSAFWSASLQTGPRLVNSAILRWDNSVVIGGCFTRINTSDRYYLARVSGVGEDVYTPSLSSVYWDFNAQVVGQGMPFSIKDLNTTTYTTSSAPGAYGTVNCTTFPVTQEGFTNVVPGQLCRFIVRRPGNNGTVNDSFRQDANILGWKVDFNS